MFSTTFPLLPGVFQSWPLFSITFVRRSSIFLKLLRFLFLCLKRHHVPRWQAKCLLGSRSPGIAHAVGGPKKPVNSGFTVRHSLFFSPAFPSPEPRILSPATYHPSLSGSACQETASPCRVRPDRTRWPRLRWIPERAADSLEGQGLPCLLPRGQSGGRGSSGPPAR